MEYNLIVCVGLAADPSRWSSQHVQLWLQWAVQNFSFECVDMSRFDGCTGAELLEQGRDCLLQRAPLYVGDILWEHLDILQKGEHQAAVVSASISDYQCRATECRDFDDTESLAQAHVPS